MQDGFISIGLETPLPELRRAGNGADRKELGCPIDSGTRRHRISRPQIDLSKVGRLIENLVSHGLLLTTADYLGPIRKEP
jgi:hypothetical protein